MLGYTKTTGTIVAVGILAAILAVMLIEAFNAIGAQYEEMESLRMQRAEESALLKMKQPIKFAYAQDYLVLSLIDQERVQETGQ